MEKELAAVVFDKEALEKMDGEARGFFMCDLSQMNVVEFLLEEDGEPNDMLGFGLAVKRPEFVIDDPTQLHIDVISSTVVVQSAIQDAIKYKIDIEGKFQENVTAHGAFGLGELGVALRGRSREAINSWLPFYVNKEHWKRVKPQLPTVLGYFCTLDPLGFAPNQFDVLFTILGVMIARLDAPGEHQLRILFAFQRTCFQAAVDFNLLAGLTEKLKNFHTSAKFRTKDVVPNLLTLVGYLAILPDMSTVFDNKDKNLESQLAEFWMVFLEEAIRRGFNNIFKETPESVFMGIVDVLLEGQEGEGEGFRSEEERMKYWLAHLADKTIREIYEKEDLSCFPPMKFDAARGFVAPVSTPPKNPNKENEKIAKEAKVRLGYAKEGKSVNNRKKEKRPQNKEDKIKEIEEKEKEKEKEEKSFDWMKVTPGMLDLIHRLQFHLHARGFPTLAAIYRSVTFVKGWTEIAVSGKNVFDELDENHGIAPERWTKIVKSHFEKQQPRHPNFGEVLSHIGFEVSDLFTFLRALLMQGIFYHSNKRAITRIESGRHANVLSGKEFVEQIMTEFRKELLLQREDAYQALRNLLAWKEINEKILNATDIYVFLGYMLRLYKEGDRNEGFKMLVEEIQKRGTAIPKLEEKMKVILTGKFEDQPIIGNGNPWVPERENRKKFIEAMGLDTYVSLEVLVRGVFQLHVYRESDKPNRHGHCNSNPYIAPEWRDLFAFK